MIYVKYEDLPDDYSDLLKSGELSNEIKSPLFVILPAKRGIRFKWATSKLMRADKEGKSSFDLLGTNSGSDFTGDTYWIPVAPSTFPKFPDVDGRIEWDGMVLCATSLPEIELIIDKHEESILDTLSKRLEFSEILHYTIERILGDKFDKVIREKEELIRDKIRCIKDNPLSMVKEGDYNDGWK